MCLRPYIHVWRDAEDDGKRDPATGVREFAGPWLATDAKGKEFSKVTLQGEVLDLNTTVVVDSSLDGEQVDWTSPPLHHDYSATVTAPFARVRVVRRDAPTGSVKFSVRAIA